MSFFSIVIPAYNCEKTIRRAINSVLSQDYGDYEIQIVNDGSTDSTQEIISEYTVKDKRIKSVTLKNSGPSAARNAGIERAGGQYLMFMDSDDLLQAGALHYLHNILAESPRDLLIYGFTITDSNLNPLMDYGVPDADYFAHETLGHALPDLYQSNILNQVWNKVYSLQWLKDTGVQFEDYRYGEDRLFVLSVLQHARSVKVIKRPCYLYINSGDSSLISSYYDKKFECCLVIDKRIRLLSNEWGNDCRHAAEVWDYMFFKSVLSSLTQYYHPTCPLKGKHRRSAIKNILSDPEVCRKLSLSHNTGIHVKLLYYVTRIKIVWINALAIRFIIFMGNRNSGSFIRLKHQKVADKSKK